MRADADLAALAELMSGHRAGLLLALMAGPPLPASELAARAGISKSLASAHLARLLDGGLVTVESHGRQRRYRLAGREIARAIEGMLAIAPPRRVNGLRDQVQGDAIRHARTCYDHLAGELGVALTDALEDRRLITATADAYELTAHGSTHFGELGIDLDAAHRRRRAFARPCLDWTERRPHLAGSLGAALADRCFALGWLERLPGTRAVRVTDPGRRALLSEFGVALA